MGLGRGSGRVCQPEAESKVAPADPGGTGLRCGREGRGGMCTICLLVAHVRTVTAIHVGGLCDCKEQYTVPMVRAVEMVIGRLLLLLFSLSSSLTLPPHFSRTLSPSAVRHSLDGATFSPPATPCCSPLTQDRSSSPPPHLDPRGACCAIQKSEAVIATVYTHLLATVQHSTAE